MKLLLIFLLTSIMIGQESVILVPAQLQSEFFKARSVKLGAQIELIQAQATEDQALGAITTFCSDQHRATAQNSNADFGCVAPTALPPNPKNLKVSNDPRSNP